MIGDLVINSQITFNKVGKPRSSSITVGDLNLGMNVTGQYRSDGIMLSTTSGNALPLGHVVGVIGWIALKNMGSSLIDIPNPPTISTVGSSGSTSYSYKIVAKQADGGFTQASSSGTEGSGNATLSVSNFNRITWTAVDNATGYDIYRTASAGTPNTTGKIGSTTGAVTFDDTGLAADGSTAPTASPYLFDILISLDGGSTYPLLLKGGESQCYRLSNIPSSIYHKAVTNNTNLAFLICDP